MIRMWFVLAEICIFPQSPSFPWCPQFTVWLWASRGSGPHRRESKPHFCMHCLRWESTPSRCPSRSQAWSGCSTTGPRALTEPAEAPPLQQARVRG